MSEPHPDPHDDAITRLAQLASMGITTAEAAVRLVAARRRTSAATTSPSGQDLEGVTGRAVSQSAIEVPASMTGRPAATTAAPRPHATAPAVQRPQEPPARTPGSRRRVAGRPVAPGAQAHGDLLAVHDQAAAFFRNRVTDSWVPDYLHHRSLDVALGTPWSAGYAPASWTALTDYLRSNGWPDAVLEASGLSRRARTGNLIDTFRDRLVLPVRDVDGAVVAFIGRARPDAPDRVPKYLNSPHTDLYDKSRILFGLAEGRDALRNTAMPVLVEGPLDAVAVTHASGGRHVGLAPCGTALTAAQVAGLAAKVNLPDRGVVVATDQDAAGVTAAVRAYDRLAPLTPHLLRAGLDPGSDPADLLHHRGPGALMSALTDRARPLLDTALEVRLRPWADRLQWVEGRVGAVRAAAPLLARLPADQRDSLCDRLAERLDVDPSTVHQAVAAVPAPSRPADDPAALARTGRQAGPPKLGTPSRSSTAPPAPPGVPRRRLR